jgi:peroxiredoxin
MVEKYLQWNVDLEAVSGESHHVLPAPATFIVASDGMIRFQYTNPDYHVRLHPDVLLAAARAYKDEADDRLRRQHKANKEAKNSAGG